MLHYGKESRNNYQHKKRVKMAIFQRHNKHLTISASLPGKKEIKFKCIVLLRVKLECLKGY